MALANIPLMHSTFFQEAETKEQLIAFIRGASRLSMGDACRQFETDFCAWQERRYAVFVSSGSAANLLLLQALLNLGRLKPGDRVGFSALTWATNVMPIIQLGMVPVPLDCEVATLNTSPDILKDRIKGLAAVFLTNVLGLCDDLSAIAALCRDEGVLLLEDNCEALGSTHQGKLLGNMGLASTFSFFVGHHLSTVEGGMVCTDEEELAQMLIMVRAHGWDRQLPRPVQAALRKEHGVSDFHAQYTFYHLAYNARPTEMQGFLGHIQLPLLMKAISAREANFQRFLACLRAKSDLYEPLDPSHLERVSSFAMPVVCRQADTLAAAIARFRDAGVEVRPVIAGDITRHPFYRKHAPADRCPNASSVHEHGLYFPNRPDLRAEEVDLLCSLL